MGVFITKTAPSCLLLLRPSYFLFPILPIYIPLQNSRFVRTLPLQSRAGCNLFHSYLSETSNYVIFSQEQLVKSMVLSKTYRQYDPISWRLDHKPLSQIALPNGEVHLTTWVGPLLLLRVKRAKETAALPPCSGISARQRSCSSE